MPHNWRSENHNEEPTQSNEDPVNQKSQEGRAWSKRWGMSALTDRLEAAYATCIVDHHAGKKTGGSELDKALSATTVLTIIGLGYIFG